MCVTTVVETAFWAWLFVWTLEFDYIADGPDSDQAISNLIGILIFRLWFIICLWRWKKEKKEQQDEEEKNGIQGNQVAASHETYAQGSAGIPMQPVHTMPMQMQPGQPMGMQPGQPMMQPGQPMMMQPGQPMMMQ